MRDDFRVEIFQSDFRFLSKGVVEPQKYEFDYMALDNNELKVPGQIEAYKRNYIQIRSSYGIFQGIITSVEHQKTETRIKYKSLLSLLDIEVYKDRTALANTSAERFIGNLIEENYVSNSDSLQNVSGLSVVYTSETMGSALNLVDNVHNIYELLLKAFRKYGIVAEMHFSIKQKSVVCTIGIPSQKSRVIEADLKNVLDVEVVIKEDDESVNKVTVVGEYTDEENPLYGQTIQRIFYRDKKTGETTQSPVERVTPVIFRYKTITIAEDTFEEDAFEAAYDLIYQEEYDNSIKVQLLSDDPLHKLQDFNIGKPCTIIWKGKKYRTVYTGWNINKTVTLLFGMVRTEYTKRMKRR